MAGILRNFQPALKNVFLKIKKMCSIFINSLVFIKGEFLYKVRAKLHSKIAKQNKDHTRIVRKLRFCSSFNALTSVRSQKS